MKKIPVIDAVGNELKNAELMRAHGLTHGQNEDLAKMQRQGIVPMRRPNRIEYLRDPFHKKEFANVEIPKCEALSHYAVIQEARTFSPTTGERLSVARLVKYTPVMWQFAQRYGLQGELSFILHDPSLEPGYVAPAPLRDDDEDEDIELYLK